MKKKARPQPKAIKGYTFAEVMERGRKLLEEEEAKIAAMTPEQRVEYAAEQAKKREEAEKILQQLRGPGFMELRVTKKP